MPSIREQAKALGIPKSTLHDQIQRARITGEAILYDQDGNIKLKWQKSSHTGGPTASELAEAVKSALEGYQPPARLPEPLSGVHDLDLATVYPLADWHIGLLAWPKECPEAWDTTIAVKKIKAAMGRLIAASPSSKQGIVLGLGDLLHADNFDGTTSKSKNVLDVDGRWPKLLQASTDLVIFTIDLALQKHEKVLVRILPGNHDELSSHAVTLALKCFYASDPRVTVDDDAGRFWWHQWGKVLLGATHGDKAKMRDLPLIMATSCAKSWGETKHRHIYTGHIHRDTSQETRGVTVESFRSPVAADSWHTSMGYAAGRSVSSITYHKHDGEIMRNKVNLNGVAG